MNMISQSLSTLSTNKYLVAICNVCIMALPLSLIATFSDVLSIFFGNRSWDAISAMLSYLSQTAILLFPILLNVYLSTYLSRIWRLPKSAAIACGLTTYLTLSYQWSLLSDRIPFPDNFAFSLLASFLICFVLNQLKRMRFFKLDHSHNIIDNSTGIILISFSSISFLIVLGFLVKFIFDFCSVYFSFPDLILTDFYDGIFYELIRQLLWSFGINGHNILQGFKTDLYQTTISNTSEWYNFGADLNIINSNFYDYFTGIGGSGNTLSLVLCMIFFAKNKTYRVLAKTVFLLSLININEPLLYGIPIIFNPIMLLPFIFVPIISFIIAYFSIYIGWVEPLSELHSWLLPPLVSGYMATGGSISGSILQLVIIILGMAMYYPFMRYMDIRSEQLNFAHIFNNQFFGSDEIEVKAKLTSYIPSMHRNFQAQHDIERLQTEGEMIVVFQPQVAILSKDIRSLETLLRFKCHNGDIRPPTFIDSFQQLGLMPELDFWVLNQSLKEVRPLMDTYDFSLSVNVSPETLLSDNFITSVVHLVTKHNFDYCKLELEITEEVMVKDITETVAVIRALQQLGIKVALDDFGSGYSSLAYLTHFDFDKIKIDRSLVTNLHCVRGQELFRVAVQLGHITNAEIVVEGVETQEEFEFVSSISVPYIQGYYFYRPMTLSVLMSLDILSEYRPAHLSFGSASFVPTS